MTDQVPERNDQKLEMVVIASVTGTLVPPAVYALVQQTEHASENNLYIAGGFSIFLGVCAIVALWKMLTRRYQ